MRPIFKEDATIVARVHDYFTRTQRRTDALVPPAEHIARMLTAAFWASLHREEGWPTRLSLAYTPPPEADRGFRFTRPVSLSPKALAKVAPAVERPGIHLGVAPDESGALHVWGAALEL